MFNEDYTTTTPEQIDTSDSTATQDYNERVQNFMNLAYSQWHSLEKANECVNYLQFVTRKKHRVTTTREGFPFKEGFFWIEIDDTSYEQPRETSTAETPESTEFQNKFNGNTYEDIDPLIDAADFSDKPAEIPQTSYDYAPEQQPYFEEFDIATERDKRNKNTLLRWNSGDKLAQDAKAPIWLIKDILEQDSHGVLFGASMTYKTFTALELAHCISTGRWFMGKPVRKQGKVLYIYGEGAGGLSRRIKAQLIEHGEFNGNLLCLDGTLQIDNPDDMKMLRETINEIKPVLVIFDTFASLIGNTKENDNGEVGRALNLIRDTCSNGFTSSIVIHHTGKDESNGARGAYAFIGNTDFQFELVKSKKDETITTMYCRKLKEAENFTPFNMKAKVIDLGIEQNHPDDKEAVTSLIVELSDTPVSNTKENKTQLKDRDLEILSAVRTAIAQKGISPPQSVIDLFPDSPQKIPQQVVHIDALREFAYPYLTMAENSKRTVLVRHIDNLKMAYKTGYYDGYLWVIDSATTQRNAT